MNKAWRRALGATTLASLVVMLAFAAAGCGGSSDKKSSGDKSSYRGRFDYTDDRYGAAAEHMLIGADFRPDVGYVRRTDFRRSFGQARFSPRPKNSRVIRKLTWQGSYDYVTDAPGVTVQNREANGLFRVDFHTSDQAIVEHSREYELLPARFPIAPGVVVPAGGYRYDTTRVSYVLGQQRKVSGAIARARTHHS